jgi:hypothetical protein
MACSRERRFQAQVRPCLTGQRQGLRRFSVLCPRFNSFERILSHCSLNPDKSRNRTCPITALTRSRAAEKSQAAKLSLRTNPIEIPSVRSSLWNVFKGGIEPSGYLRPRRRVVNERPKPARLNPTQNRRIPFPTRREVKSPCVTGRCGLEPSRHRPSSTMSW